MRRADNKMKDTSKRFLNVHLSISPIASGDNKGGVSQVNISYGRFYVLSMIDRLTGTFIGLKENSGC